MASSFTVPINSNGETCGLLTAILLSAEAITKVRINAPSLDTVSDVFISVSRSPEVNPEVHWQSMQDHHSIFEYFLQKKQLSIQSILVLEALKRKLDHALPPRLAI